MYRSIHRDFVANEAVGFDVEFGELQLSRRFWISGVAVATGLPVSIVGNFWRSRSSSIPSDNRIVGITLRLVLSLTNQSLGSGFVRISASWSLVEM